MQGAEAKYQEWLTQSPRKVASELRKQPEITRGFVRFLFGATNTRGVLVWVSNLIAGGEEPEAFLQELQKTNPVSPICREVWTEGQYFYRCRDCEMSPSSSVCSSCFKAADHENHDFVFETSVYGGCCDCGNVQAWKPEGFCPCHTGKYSEDVLLHLPEALRTVALGVYDELFSQLMLMYDKEPMSPSATAIVSWMRSVGANEAFMHLTRMSLFAGTNPPVTKLLQACLAMEPYFKRGEDENPLLFLILEAISDPSFKGKLMKIYIEAYPQFVESMLKFSKVNVVYKLSPQLFSIEPLVWTAVCEDGLLDVLIREVTSMFKQLSVTDSAGRSHVDLSRPVMSRRNWFAFSNDLQTALDHTNVSRLVLTQRADLLQRFLELLRMGHEIDPTTREVAAHVEYESTTWNAAYSFDSELSRCSANLIKCLENSSGQISLADFQRVIKMVSEVLFDPLPDDFAIVDW
eukprot:TRINITY_DN6139_c0_g1_i1.p1 TRINITY_DN6139_c0_g1~~TRINITY_DN6139_c0_g1_i1.p1  ORF type:complete len:462 (+),score=113.83 TRINITY_DN6139_c0_g1_i1:119-1504(+)